MFHSHWFLTFSSVLSALISRRFIVFPLCFALSCTHTFFPFWELNLKLSAIIATCYYTNTENPFSIKFCLHSMMLFISLIFRLFYFISLPLSHFFSWLYSKRVWNWGFRFFQFYCNQIHCQRWWQHKTPSRLKHQKPIK